MTAEPSRRLSWRLPEQLRSVRTRILAWVVILTAAGLASAGAAAYVLEGTRIDHRIDEAIRQEIEEFEELQARGIDPRTGEAFTSINRLLQVALTRNVPDEHEAIIGFLDGRPAFVHPGTAHDLDRNNEFVAAVTALLPDGGFGTLDTSAGEVRYAVKPVTQLGDDRRGAYVVAYFVAQEEAEFHEVVRIYSVVAGCALLIIAAAAYSVAGRLLRPVRDLRIAAQEISDTDLTRRIAVQGNDDLSDLALTFNAMLDRLEAAFATQRRFLDDAGHELRTPITIVRGHLELLDERDPDEVATTRALVLDEIDRMSRLVEELVVLAKADRPDFLYPRPLDLGAFTDDVLDKSRALGERNWVLDARASILVQADAQRLTQALLQLAANAVQHTRPGDVVAIGSAADGETFSMWVRDTGTGVPGEYVGRIFERFQRGPHAHGMDGSGLGLSIVRAIAEAHGGRVELINSPGEGATFVIVVPRRPVTQTAPSYHDTLDFDPNLLAEDATHSRQEVS